MTTPSAPDPHRPAATLLPADTEGLPTRARALRRTGLSTAQIARELGVPRNGTLDSWLRGVPPPDWTRRPRAKDDVRRRARALRASGKTYEEIAAELDVSKSTCSLWLRDMPVPPPRSSPSIDGPFSAVGSRPGFSKAAMRRREAVRQQQKLTAARQIPPLDASGLLVAAAVAYWCEGSKDKPYDRRETVQFCNSDPLLIRLWMTFLRHVGVHSDRLRCRVHLHETADVDQAVAYWASIIDVPADRFSRTTIKRHAPRTNRRNTGDRYHGCLTIRVAQSAELYRQIEGWFYAAVAASERVSVSPVTAEAVMSD